MSWLDGTKPPDDQLPLQPPPRLPVFPRLRSSLQDCAGWSRPYHADVPTKAIRFERPEDKELAHILEAIAQLERVKINHLMLHLIRQGLRAEGYDL